MSIEDLWKDRYKVIADYPGRIFLIGAILHIGDTMKDGKIMVDIVHENQLEGYMWNPKDNNHFDDYPHLFKKLSWWEERDLEDLPEYIRFYEPLPERFKIGKIEEWRRGLKSPIVKVDFEICYRELSILDKPATKEEYESYLKSKQ